MIEASRQPGVPIDENRQLVKKSDYSIVDQLNRTAARISLLELIRCSELHREAVRRILDQSYVNDQISPEGLTNLVAQIRLADFLSFTKDEIDSEGPGHNKALYITLNCNGFFVAKVLVDNGAALNILPEGTLSALSMSRSLLRPDTTMVRAFDGSQRLVLGVLDLEVVVGGHPFLCTFHVLDISPSYTMLLGRPWIHTAGAVPSTLHQRLKFIANDKLIVVKAEEAMLVCPVEGVPYVDKEDDGKELSFTSFEVVKATAGPSTSSGKGADLAFYQLCHPENHTEKLWASSGNQARTGLGYSSEIQELQVGRKDAGESSHHPLEGEDFHGLQDLFQDLHN